jgi:ATP-dependent RNA helicase RhlE
MTFNKLGLRAELLQALEKKGYSIPTPIQAQSILPILEGKDVMGGAQTGTGKTAAFTLPLLQNLFKDYEGKGFRTPRALILCPTRELAAQILQSIYDYGAFLPLEAAAIFGGVKIGPQIDKIRRGLDIVVATPGRLIDHLNQKTLDLSRVEILVLDEADRMLDMGFIKDIQKILKVLPPRRQNMLFSATFNKDIKKLSQELLNKPVLIEVNPENSAADLVEQVVHNVEKTDKRHLLAHLIKEGNWYQVLVFTRTKHGAQRLSQQLVKAGIPSMAIHGDKTQGARTRALGDFKQGKLQVLVATDIAARGLDIVQLSHVVNYDMPNAPEDYIHRIGRTGRAGEVGQAVSFCSPDETDKLKAVEKLLGRKITVEKVTDFIAPAPREETSPRQKTSYTARTSSSEPVARKVRESVTRTVKELVSRTVKEPAHRSKSDTPSSREEEVYQPPLPSRVSRPGGQSGSGPSSSRAKRPGTRGSASGNRAGGRSRTGNRSGRA